MLSSGIFLSMSMYLRSKHTDEHGKRLENIQVDAESRTF